MIFNYLKRKESIKYLDNNLPKTVSKTKIFDDLDYLKNSYQNEKMGNLDEKHKEWKKKFLK
tara:strand:- start:412 stop:594 length:183 start_codon:yes stop_codon:yes gene_type:complete